MEESASAACSDVSAASAATSWPAKRTESPGLAIAMAARTPGIRWAAVKSISLITAAGCGERRIFP
jgi:hypothetical protein